jgi:hypothetical protein
MSIFIDTCIFIAYVNRKDEYHSAATGLLESIMKNKYGAAFTSDFVFNELMTFILYKTGDVKKAGLARDMILGNEKKDIPRFINMLFIDPEILEKGWITFARYADKKLSFTDCSIIELMKNKGIDHLASFDGGFDGIVSRIRY